MQQADTIDPTLAIPAESHTSPNPIGDELIPATEASEASPAPMGDTMTSATGVSEETPQSWPKLSTPLDLSVLPLHVRPALPPAQAPIKTWQDLWEASNSRFVSDEEVALLMEGHTLAPEPYVTAPYELDPRFQRKVPLEPAHCSPHSMVDQAYNSSLSPPSRVWDL